MSEARKRILQMLSEGKISVGQSEELLSALDADNKAQETSGMRGSLNAFSAELGNLAKQVKKQVN
ncbi:hypothetical protein HYY75_12035, partial [bacterium]|nr:hypothetical protein [bacterium]